MGFKGSEVRIFSSRPDLKGLAVEAVSPSFLDEISRNYNPEITEWMLGENYRAERASLAITMTMPGERIFPSIINGRK